MNSKFFVCIHNKVRDKFQEEAICVTLDLMNKRELIRDSSHICKNYRDSLKGLYVVWGILFLLLLTSSASTCLQHSRNLVQAF